MGKKCGETIPKPFSKKLKLSLSLHQYSKALYSLFIQFTYLVYLYSLYSLYNLYSLVYLCNLFIQFIYLVLYSLSTFRATV